MRHLNFRAVSPVAGERDQVNTMLREINMRNLLIGSALALALAGPGSAFAQSDSEIRELKSQVHPVHLF